MASTEQMRESHYLMVTVSISHSSVDENGSSPIFVCLVQNESLVVFLLTATC